MNERTTGHRTRPTAAAQAQVRGPARAVSGRRGPRGDRPRWAGSSQRRLLAAAGRDRWLPLLHRVLAVARGVDVLAAAVSIAAATGTVTLTVAAGEEPGPAAVGLLGAVLAYPVWRVTGHGRRRRMARVVAVSGLQLLLVASTAVGLRLAASGHLTGAVVVVVASAVLPGVGWALAGGVLVDVRGRLAGAAIGVDVSPAAAVDRPSGRLSTWQWSQVVGRAAAEVTTGRILMELDRSWTVLHDRQLGSELAAAHLLIGPPGVIVVQSSLWAGSITAQLWLTEDGDVGSRYDVNGDPDGVQDVAGGAAAAAGVLRMAAGGGWPVPVHAAVVAHVAGLPVGWVTLDVADVAGQVGEGSADPAPVTVVGPWELLAWLTGLPPAAHSRRGTRAVARVCDRAFPPAR